MLRVYGNIHVVYMFYTCCRPIVSCAQTYIFLYSNELVVKFFRGDIMAYTSEAVCDAWFINYPERQSC